jgi:hypothetical protein
VHDPVCDWEWFVHTFPEQQDGASVDDRAKEMPGQSAVDSETMKQRIRRTAFWTHASGLCRFDGQLWKPAIHSFMQSAQLRDDEAVPDWLYLAMAHAKIGEAEVARSWYDKADQWIREHAKESVEHLPLRDRTAEALQVQSADN